jgi:hypothetical protein
VGWAQRGRTPRPDLQPSSRAGQLTETRSLTGPRPAAGRWRLGACSEDPRPTKGERSVLRWPEPFVPCHDRSAAGGRLRRRHLMGSGRTISPPGRRAPGRIGVPRPCRFNFGHLDELHGVLVLSGRTWPFDSRCQVEVASTDHDIG